MYETSDIKNGLKVEMDGYPWTVVYFQFVKPGKGTAFTRTKFKNLMTGNVVERTLRTGERLTPADVAEDNMTYLYNDGEMYTFMNDETFDQVAIQASVLGDDKQWLLEQMKVRVLFYKSRPVNMELPTFIDIVVKYTEPATKGNTSQGALKTAEFESGATTMVPLFIETGDTVRIDTRTGEYCERMIKK